MGSSHVFGWWVNDAGLSSEKRDQRGCSLTSRSPTGNVLKFVTFNGACPVVDYVGRLQPVQNRCMLLRTIR